MTTSITFDDTRNNCSAFLATQEEIGVTSENTSLTDPEAPREALQRLRILKTRETGDIAQIPNTMGRTSGNNIDFNSYTYFDLSMRRKAEVLRKPNMTTESSKTNYSRIIQGKSLYRNMSQTRLKNLYENSICDNQNVIIKKSTEAGVKNGRDLLVYNPSIPYFPSL
jgi:hypothetical protein